MTDEKYTLIQDIKEKKAAGRGAFARKGGSKSKRCTLPSDHLTPAQLKRRNSPVMTIKLNEPMTYEQFKTLTPTLKFLYLDHLIHEYEARRIDIITMLGISQTMWAKLVPTIAGKLVFEGKPKHPSKKWQTFLAGGAPEVQPSPAPEEEPTVSVQPLTVETPLIPRPPVLPDRVTLEITGTPAELMDLLAVFTDADSKYSFTITLHK